MIDDAIAEAVRRVLRDEIAPLRAAIEALAASAVTAPVTLDAAAGALGRSPATLRRLAAAGKLPGAVRVGRAWRVDLGAMRAAGSQDRIGQLAAAAREAR